MAKRRIIEIGLFTYSAFRQVEGNYENCSNCRSYFDRLVVYIRVNHIFLNIAPPPKGLTEIFVGTEKDNVPAIKNYTWHPAESRTV